MKLDCLFTLKEDMTADVLLNFVPYQVTWHIEGLNICIELENGGSLKLEKQFDDTLFGTLVPYANASVQHVEFEITDPFTFEKPLSLEKFKGAWELCALHDSMFFHYTADQLTFSMTLEIGDTMATIDQISATNPNHWEYGVDIAGVPILEDSHMGTAVLLRAGGSKIIPAWQLSDGTLYLRLPGSQSCYFTKK